MTISVETATNVRSGPGTSNRVVGQIKPGETMTVDGQNEAGDWLRVLLPDGATGWVSKALVTIEGDTTPLTVVDTTTDAPGVVYAPMQAFYFTSGVGASDCLEAPEDGLLIQTPEGAGKVNLLINEVSVELGSTAYIRAQKNGEMTFDLLEGSSTVTVSDTSVHVLPGTRASIPLDADGSASGVPTLTTIPDNALNALDGVIGLLPDPIDLPTPLTQAEIEAASQVTLPEAGTWTTVTTGSAQTGCPDTPLGEPEPVIAELVPTSDGFTMMYPSPVTYVGDGTGHFTATVEYEGIVLNYIFDLTAPGVMTGKVDMDMASSGLACIITWEFEATRQ